MDDEKNIGRKMNVSVFPFVLSLYIIMGIAAMVLYALDTGLIGREDQKVAFTPQPYAETVDAGEAEAAASASEEERVYDNTYDTTDGTAGAARDF